MIRAAVLYRDDDVIALDKPPGLAVQGGTGTRRHVDGLAEALRFGAAEKPRLVHRLDRDTSGVLLLARSARAAAALARAFQARSTRKVYWAAVAGAPSPRAGTIRTGLVKAPGHGAAGEGEKMLVVASDRVAATEGAKRAVTDYAVIDAAADPRRLGGARAGHRPHPPAPRPDGGDRPPDRRRRQVRRQRPGEPRRRLGRAARRRGQPQAAPARPLDRAAASDHRQARSVVTAPLPEHMARTWELFGWRPEDAPDDPFEERR